MAEKDEITVKYEIEGNEIKLTQDIVQRFLTGDARITLPEFKFFTELCKVRKLNPFLKEVYLVKYGNNPAQIVVGKDAILKRAILNKNFDGREQGIIVAKKDGIIERKIGSFKMPEENLVGGWAKVYRKDVKFPTEITVSFEESAQHKGDGSLNFNWANKPCVMVEKVALVKALRETFAEDFGGMIDEDEIWDNKNLGRETIAPDVIQDEPLEIIEVE